MRAANGQTSTRLLAVITTILVIAALKLAHHVLLPVAGAIFLIVLAWPLQTMLERRAPRWVAFLSTLLVVLLCAATVAGAFVWSSMQVIERAPEIGKRLDRVSQDLSSWAGTHNVPLPIWKERREGSGSGEPAATAPGGRQLGGVEILTSLLGRLASKAYSTLGLLGLIFAFLLLGLLEVRDFETKVTSRLRRRVGDKVLDTAAIIAGKIRRFLLALTITSAVSGVATGLFALAMGLELALLWGFTAFLLNYIPTLGPLVATIPPTLFALLQFDGLTRPLAVFLGIGGIQFLIGNFIDPKIEGYVLSLSPVVVLFAIVFWGWIWGVFGALLAVPITVAVVIVCQQFPSTRWIAALVTEVDGQSGEE